MKIEKYFIPVFCLFLALASCTTENKKLSDKILKLEKELMSPGGQADTLKAGELVRNYEAFVAQYPKDTLCPRYLQKAGEVSMNTGNALRSIEFFGRVGAEYPTYRKAAECLFMKAFVYETSLGDLEKAKETYQEFIAKYPNHGFADDAKAMLQNLGKSPEDLMKEFDAKNATVETK